MKIFCRKVLTKEEKGGMIIKLSQKAYVIANKKLKNLEKGLDKRFAV